MSPAVDGINQLDSAKFLEVMFQSDLKMDCHVSLHYILPLSVLCAQRMYRNDISAAGLASRQASRCRLFTNSLMHLLCFLYVGRILIC